MNSPTAVSCDAGVREPWPYGLPGVVDRSLDDVPTECKLRRFSRLVCKPPSPVQIRPAPPSQNLACSRYTAFNPSFLKIAKVRSTRSADGGCVCSSV